LEDRIRADLSSKLCLSNQQSEQKISELESQIDQLTKQLVSADQSAERWKLECESTQLQAKESVHICEQHKDKYNTLSEQYEAERTKFEQRIVDLTQQKHEAKMQVQLNSDQIKLVEERHLHEVDLLNHTVQQLEQDKANLQQQILHLQSQVNQVNVNQNETIHQLKLRHSQELDLLNNKIQTVLQKKDLQIATLKQQLEHLQLRLNQQEQMIQKQAEELKDL